MRDSKDTYFIRMLDLVCARSTCLRRSVGAIITDATGHILATGYNGTPVSFAHCTVEAPCPGAHDPPGNTDRCLAVHAESNAVLQCHRLDLAHTMYVSVAPCFTCAKLILNTPIQRVVVAGSYADARGAELLRAAGRLWFYDYESDDVKLHTA